MGRYFVYLSYDGTCYHGWQVQPNGKSVQGELSRALSMHLKEEVLVTGAGRTDAGVHARLMVAHFDSDCVLDPAQLASRVDRMLPQDIRVYRIEQVDDSMHARFSARRRTYHYYVHEGKLPFERFFSCPIYGTRLDFGLMNKAASILLEYEDFTSFSKSHTDTKTNICHIDKAYWENIGEDRWMFVISADRFLRNMVRAIVGTLLEVGRGKLSLDGFRDIIVGKDRCLAGESVLATALFLWDIEY